MGKLINLAKQKFGKLKTLAIAEDYVSLSVHHNPREAFTQEVLR